MFHFLETDRRQQKKYEMRTQASVDNTVNDLRYEIKFESCVKDKNNYFVKRNNTFFSWTKIYFILGDIFVYNSYEFNYLINYLIASA